jgi:integrase
MARLRFTSDALERIKRDPKGKQRFYWDITQAGLGLVVSGKTESRTFVVQFDVDGKTIRRKLCPYAKGCDIDAVRREAKDALGDLYKGVDPKQKRAEALAKEAADRVAAVTLGEALEDYIEMRSHTDRPLRAPSIRDYRETINRHLGDWMDLPIRDVTEDMVTDRFNEIRQGGKYAANFALRVFGIMHNHAARRRKELRGNNPVQALKGLWNKEGRRQTAIETSQLPAFYSALRGLHHDTSRDLVLLMLFTGLRNRAASGLEWSEVNLAKRRLEIPGERMKGREPLWLPLPQNLVDMLKSRHSDRNSDYVFPSYSGSGHLINARHPLLAIAQRTGISVCANDLRRNFITTAESELPAAHVKALVGHVSDDVTIGYVVRKGDDLEQWMKRLAVSMAKVTDRIMTYCQPTPVVDIKTAKRRSSV